MKFLSALLFVTLAVLPTSKPLLVNTIPGGEKNILLERKWDMQEMRLIQNNEMIYYKRGNLSESTINFDDDNIIFNCGGTGVYHQSDDTDFPLKWRFIEDKQNAIEFTIENFRSNNDLVVNWENIELSDNTIKYTEYYTHKNGTNSLGCGIRVTKDSANPNIDITAATIVADAQPGF